jgi:hypothetical protein
MKVIPFQNGWQSEPGTEIESDGGKPQRLSS